MSSSPSRGRIVLLESIDVSAKLQLEAAGFEVELLSTGLSEDDLIAKLRGCVAVGIRSKTYITPRVLRELPELQVIGAYCIGTNQIDLEGANARGLPAFNAPFSNTRSVAEMILAEIVFLARKLGDSNNQMHAGRWKKSSDGCHEIRGKRLGIVGYGHIGRQVGVLAEAFGMKVRFYDIVSKLPMGNNEPAATLEELMREVDFVTLHVPGTPETREMIGAEQIGWMKKGSYLLNASRGNVIVIPELKKALTSGHLAGAAVDVYPKEPKSNNEDFLVELAGLPNTILTPHVGGSTEEAQISIASEVSGALIRYLTQGSTLGAVNFPLADLSTRHGGTRIQHIHRNVPGVLSAVNRIVSEAEANILGQVLVTDENIGYLLMDVDQKVAPEVCEKMRALETTISTRVIE